MVRTVGTSRTHRGATLSGPPELQDRLRRQLQQALGDFGAALGPDLAPAFDTLIARREASDSDVFAPLGHPVLLLAHWMAAAVESPPRTAVLDRIAIAAAFGYLHVSVQDALVDEGLGDPAVSMFLSDRLRERHTGLLRAAVGPAPRYWTLHEQVWADYGRAMLLERRKHTREADYTREDFERVLDRSMPLLLPGAAVLSLADRWALLPELKALVRALVTSAQLWDDLVDLEVDLEAGNHTWLVRRLGGLDGLAALRRGLVQGCGLDEVCDEIGAQLAAARHHAAALGLEIAEFLDARSAAVEDHRERAWTAYFARFAGEGGVSAACSPEEVTNG